jgi:hypothetical protein
MRRAARVIGSGLSIVAVVALGAGCSGDDDTAAGTTTSAPRSTTSTKAPSTTTTSVWHVNEKVRADTFGIEVFGVDDPYEPEGQDVPPADGMRYVAVDMEVRNLATKPTVVVSGLQLDIEDSNGEKYSPKGGGHGQGPIDGELKSDETKRRAVVYEVPEDATGFTLLLTGRFGGTIERIALG